MKNKTWSIIGAVAAFVLCATLIVGILPGKEAGDLLGTSTMKPGVSTDVMPGTNVTPGGDNDPSHGSMSFANSDAITKTFMASLKNAAWTYDGEGNPSYSEGSLYRVALPSSYQYPDSKLLVRYDPSIEARIADYEWYSGRTNESFEPYMFHGHLTFKYSNSSEISPEKLEGKIQIYDANEILQNLKREDLTNEELNELINLLVVQGIYRESSTNGIFYWKRSEGEGGNYLNRNRISMRYSVSLPYDVRVSFNQNGTVSSADDYEYVMILFESETSYKGVSSVGWTTCQESGDFVIPANTPFCIGLRPYGLDADALYSFYDDPDLRDQYGYVDGALWNDLIQFEHVK